MSKRNKKATRPAGKSWYQIKNQVNGETEINIMENIGFWGVSASQFKNDLKRLGEKEPIHVHINSDGGDIIEGNEIFNILMDHKGTVRVTIGAMAASIASVIAMAGDSIQIAPNGFVMIHNPWSIAMGDSAEFLKVAEQLDKFKASIIGAYKRQCNLSDKEIAKMMDDETYMNADEALENGFVDSILEQDRDSDEALNHFDLSKFRNSAEFLTRPEVERLMKTGDRHQSGGNPEQDQQDLSGKQEQKHEPILIRNQIIMKTKEGEVADPPTSPAEVEAEIKKRADALYATRLKCDQEIDDIVVQVRKRDKKDFAELAATYKRDQKSADEFARAIVSSDQFKKFDVVGSGIEVIEPLDSLKGSPGFQVVTSERYKALADLVNKRGRNSIPQNTQQLIEVPTTIRDFMNSRWFNAPAEPTSAGLTSIEKLPGVIQLGVRPLMVKDLIAPGATSNTTVRYIREVSFTNYATPVGEGIAKPEALFEYAEVDAPVRKIAAYTKVTDELFADYLAVASYINQRLPYMVERAEEDQILNGDGISPDLLGILQTPGIQTQAKGADTAPDAIYKAMTKVRFTGFFEPDGLIIHPTDFQNLRLLKDSAGQYLGGGPFTGAYGNSPLVQFDSLWGKPCAITPAITVGTALVGSFRLGAQYFQRQGLTVEMTNSDQDDFIKNRMTIRVEERLALAVYRPLAFSTVTGL